MLGYILYTHNTSLCRWGSAAATAPSCRSLEDPSRTSRTNPTSVSASAPPRYSFMYLYIYVCVCVYLYLQYVFIKNKMILVNDTGSWMVNNVLVDTG
jgi:hypothetical protein